MSLNNIVAVAGNRITSGSLEDPVFDTFVSSINENIIDVINRVRTDEYTPLAGRIQPKGYVFKDNKYSNNLWNLFINNIDEDIRQQYNCNSCRSFIDHWGDLVVIDMNNKIISLLWNEETVPDIFKRSVKAMREACELGAVTLALFYTNANIPVTDKHCSSNDTIGKMVPKSRVDKEYNHLYILRDSLKGTNISLVYGDYLNSISTILKVAKERDKYIDRYVSIMNSDMLVGVEKYRWTTAIKDLKREFSEDKVDLMLLCVKYSCISNWKWSGFRGSVAGQVFEAVCDDILDESIIRQYDYLTDPLKYMRPTAAPSDSLIKQANKLFEEYNITADSLRRRPARVDELTYFWRDSYVEKPSVSMHGIDKSGVFDSLLGSNTKKESSIMVSKHKMSMNKFLYKILPDCDKVSIIMPIMLYSMNMFDSNLSNRGVWFTTATIPDSAPILRWDKEHSRQPVSQFQFANPVSISSYIPKSYIRSHMIDVYGICYDSQYWNSDINPETISSSGINFVFDGGTLPAKKTRLDIFPECVDSRFYSIRKVIESYSNNNYLDPIEPDGASPACGIRYSHSNNVQLALRVHHKHNGWMDISITVYETE